MVQRQPSMLSSLSQTDTVVESRLAYSHRHAAGARTIVIAIKATAQDRLATEPTDATPNHLLIDRALAALHISGQDTILLANVRPEVVSAKTKWYDSSIAVYASIYGAEERQRSLQLLQRYQSQLQRRGFRCRALALHGDKREQILAAAIREQADCIVVGQQRRHGPLTMKRSLSASLMQSCDIPTLAVNLPR
ncbi:hypothetical protein H4S02_005276 [Coemansia sp. RSA 2611]|nr:hypothetical protein LPJ70_001518 [Coemansia sp. RSA 2708]KAJ2363491.1 hypothetical protein H4S01_004275 [Coemansia sp. RSA 2610]KAJ2383488.1 hypothetical protein H4S02_005276 [Coemansia sp. RSA 2611]